MNGGWAKVKQAAPYAGVKERTFRKWLREGLRYSRLPSGTVLVKYSEIDKFLESFEVGESCVDQIVEEVVSDLS
ncbi:MAG: hypothetical protein JW743_02220 [Deltaproteobacteria bacterium]|nr:hypothetical protein [Deltaproteobacteria bacterium]MBN2844653.1 hypothetical protein [Deltaproteobacteria bacterium]